MLGTVTSAAIIGLRAERVDVECDIALGLPNFLIVGLPDKSVEESRERVRAAIRNSGGIFPPRRITVNLAPADVRKVGPSYDLAIATSVLAATGQLPLPELPVLIAGELSLDGTVRSTTGVLASLLGAKEWGVSTAFIAADNIAEAQLVQGIALYPVRNLTELINHFRDVELIKASGHRRPKSEANLAPEVNLADIAGQEHVKRALEIAAAGGHNLLLSGPPGSGKTLLAKALSGILPEMSFEEQLELTKIYSIAGLLSSDQPLITRRPMRHPHHTSSTISLTGGGAWPRPGEISLAHRGVLFLDEIAEFPRWTLEALRQPLEDRQITISRAAMTLQFPADITLIASANPCPCGFAGEGRCTCSASAIQRYGRRLSGPFLDRIDLRAWVPGVQYEQLADPSQAEPTSIVRLRVEAARQSQRERFIRTEIATNAEMQPRHIRAYCPLSDECNMLLRRAMHSNRFSARTYHRIIKVARSIADLDGADRITPAHLAEAIHYRCEPSLSFGHAGLTAKS